MDGDRDAAFACLLRGADGIEEFVARAALAFAGDHNLSHARALAECVAGLSDRLPEGLRVETQEQPFAALMAAVLERRAAAGGGDPGPGAAPAVVEVGPEFDFLAERCGLGSLWLLQVCCLALQARRVGRHRMAVVVTARDEGIYLPEWIAHYRLAGADHIFLYSNDNGDGSDPLLEALAQAGMITLLRNRPEPGVNPQVKAYQHAILLLDALRDYRWVLFVDADEFLFFGDQAPGRIGRFIDEVERREDSARISAVFMPWRWRLTDRQYSRHSIPVLAQYGHYVDRTEGKSLVRLAAVSEMCGVHLPDVPEGWLFVDGMLRRMDPLRVGEGVARPYDGPVIEHFWSKSFIEYLTKMRRSEVLTLKQPSIRRGVKNFFLWTAPLAAHLLKPIDREWIALVAAETEVVLRRPEVAAAYGAAVAQYRAMVDAALGDAGLMALYLEHMNTVQPGFR